MQKMIQCVLFTLIAVSLFANVLFVMGAGASGFQMGAFGWFIFDAECVLGLSALTAAFGSLTDGRSFQILSLGVAIAAMCLFGSAVGYSAFTSLAFGARV